MTDPKIKRLAVADIDPNPWNPNRQNAFMYAKELDSIREHGFLVPVIVRFHQGRYQLIDGEHRWKAAVDLGIDIIPAVILPDDTTDSEAKRLTIKLNEIRGQFLPAEMGSLIGDLLKDYSLEEMIEDLPFTEETLRGLIGDLPELPELSKDQKQDLSADERRWVEKLYRMPLAAAKVLDDALAKAKAGDQVEDWQALERLAAEYMAG